MSDHSEAMRHVLVDRGVAEIHVDAAVRFIDEVEATGANVQDMIINGLPADLHLSGVQAAIPVEQVGSAVQALTAASIVRSIEIIGVGLPVNDIAHLTLRTH